ncbi:T9SS type A sorting domain-containing protein [bacterium]|nr:T9SS type A sorting domain-containing protein [bacterium]
MPRTIPRLCRVAILTILSILPLTGGAVAQTLDLVALPAQVGSGLQSGSSTRVHLSDSQHGGVLVTIEVDDPALGLVAESPNQAGEEIIEVFVPNGFDEAFFVVQGIENTTGTLGITASAIGYAGDSGSVDVVAPAVVLINVEDAISVPDPGDPFQVQTGIPSGSGVSVQAVRVGGPGAVATITTDAPTVSELETLTLTGSTVTVAVAPGSSASPQTLAQGGVEHEGLSSGTATLTASIPGFISQPLASHTVTVDAATVDFFLSGSPIVGSGLMSGTLQARINGTEHGGTTVHLASSNPAALLVSLDGAQAGTPSVDVFVPDGQSNFLYFLHGMEGQTGAVALVATATGLETSSLDVELRQPSLDITALASTITTLDAPDPFTVAIGYPNLAGTNLTPQRLRIGGPGLTVTASVDAPLIGQIVTGSGSGQSQSLYAGPGAIEVTGFALDGVGAGVTTVTASAPGFADLPDLSSQEVTVEAPELLPFGDDRVGAGLATSNGGRYVNLSSGDHGGIIVHFAVDDPSKALLSPDNDETAGTPTLDVVVPDGQTRAYYAVHGLEDLTGTVVVTATAPGFTSATHPIDVVPRWLRGPNPFSIDTFDPAVTYLVRVGIETSSGLFSARNLRPGVPPLPVTVSLDNSLVGELETLTETGPEVTVDIQPGEQQTRLTVADGGVLFDGLTPGVVNVSLAAPSSSVWPATYTVTVNPTAIQPTVHADRYGAGLQATRRFTLGGSDHGGVTVRLESLDPEKVLLSNGTDPGTPFVDVVVPDGQVIVDFYVVGLENQSGGAAVRATAPGFEPLDQPVTVEQPALRLNGLTGTIDVADPARQLNVEIGVPNGSGTNLYAVQALRIGVSPLTATIVSTDASIVELSTLGETGAVVTTEIQPGQSHSPTTVSAGGASMRGVGPGEAIVSASIPGFIQTGAAEDEVLVTNNGVALPGVPAALGAGLQAGPLSAILATPDHGGITVTISSSQPSRMLVSDDPNAIGAASIDIVLPDGNDTALYYLQGIEGTAGTATVTAAAAGFEDGQANVLVQPPAVQIAELESQLQVGGATDPFVIQLGIPLADMSGLARFQVVRPGGTAPSVVLTVDDPAVALLETLDGTADTLTITVPAGSYQSAATVAEGGIALVPVALGVVSVAAGGLELVATAAATREVEVVQNTGAEIPPASSLAQNVPNPFNPSTTIRFALPRPGEVQLHIYDVRGRLLRSLVDGPLDAGQHAVTWQGRDGAGERVASGVYFCRLVTEDQTFTRKMTLLK